MAIEIDCSNDFKLQPLPLDLAPEVEVEKLLLSGMEPEPGEIHLQGASDLHASLPRGYGGTVSPAFLLLKRRGGHASA